MSARGAAAELLVAVLDHGATLDDALESTPSFATLEGRDRAFAHAIAAASLRRLGGIDAMLARLLERPLPQSATLARALLRSGAAQILVLGTPAHAAVGETVAAANALSQARGFAKLINAVLRRVVGEGAAALDALAPGGDLPTWLFTRWRAAYGAATAAAIAAALRAEPPLDLSVKDNARHWAARLGGILLPTESVRLSSPSRSGDGGEDRASSDARSGPEGPRSWRGVGDLPGFAEGAWWVQDAAAALPALLLGDVRGQNVLDLCAAPGKTLQLAAGGAHVTALDRSRERLKRLEQNLRRTQLNAKVICADALALKIREPFDAVLLDAPCTATGTLRRHPEIAWLRKPDDVRALSELQGELLSAAAQFVKPAGRLVYAVCSLEPEEGPGVIAQALQGGAWRREPLARGEIAGGDEFIISEGDLRTLPSHWSELGGLDGFYAARLVKT